MSLATVHQRVFQSPQKPRFHSRSLHFESLEPRVLLHAGHAGTLDAMPAEGSTPLAVAALPPQSLLPDLIPLASASEGFVYDWTIQGNDLRLTTAAANIGSGRMELRGGATHGDTQDVYQRIFDANGSSIDVLAGTFIYHPEHGHIHFEGFSEYRLRTVLVDGGVGPIVASGDKVSFCLLDVERYDSSGPFIPRYLTCGQVQGISVGWADVYDRGLPGQSIDISGVPDGAYWLEVVVDPQNHLIESNEDNNVVRIQIDLQRTGGGSAITPDVFESNDSFATASILAPPEDHVYPELNIHTSGNSDYYRITASASGTMTFRLAFQDSQGDIDMEVFDAAQTRIGRATSTSNNEQVSFTAVAGQYYFVRAYGYDGATNTNYTFTIDQPAGESTSDPFEENDSFAAAYTLPAVDQVYNGLSIGAANDDDFYKVVPTTSGTMTVSLAFVDAQGDIDMRILNASQSELDRSTSSGNNEQVTWQVTAGQSYYIRVYGYRGAANPSYTMAVNVPEAPAPGTGSVTYLSATAGGSLLSTDGSSPLSFTDADILKLTVQSNGQYGYQLHFDGSDVGLTTTSEDIDAFTFLPDGSIVISTTGSFSVPLVGDSPITGSGQDLLRFVPTMLGTETAGTWSMYFDASDVGLASSSENIDAVAILSSGVILISTTGDLSATGAAGRDEDLFAFTPTQLGATTTGNWAMYFDGSDVGIGSNDIDGLYVRETSGNLTLFLSLLDSFSATGVNSANEDAVAFTPTSLGANTAGVFGPALALDGSIYGLGSFNVDGVHLVPPAIPFATSIQNAAFSAAFATYPAPTPHTTSPRSSSNNVAPIPVAPIASTPTSGCGCRQSVVTPAESLIESDRRTAWDFIPKSLGRTLHGIYRR